MFLGVYRGHLGRLRFKHFLALRVQENRRRAAVNIQRIYRGYRGAILAVFYLPKYSLTTNDDATAGCGSRFEDSPHEAAVLCGGDAKIFARMRWSYALQDDQGESH